MINIENTCKFLSHYLGMDHDRFLKSLQVNKKGKEREHCHYIIEGDKSTIIEIACNNEPKELENNTMYAQSLFAEKDNLGNDKYSKIIQFNLNNFAFENNDKIVDVYTFQNENGVLLDNRFIIILIFIPNLRKKYLEKGIESLSEAERFLLILIETNIEEAKKLAKGDPIMTEYIEEAIKVSHAI